MCVPLIPPDTRDANMANVCFPWSAGLEKKCSLRELFVDVIAMSLLWFLTGKMDFLKKIKIHLGKLWTCLGEISSIKTVLKIHRASESCHGAQTSSQVVSPLWFLLSCKENYEEELKGVYMYFYRTSAYFHCKCPPQSKFPILFKWVWKNIEVPSGRRASHHWIINQDINNFCSGSIFEFIIKMYTNL